ncbi:hypothetical protein Moror_1365, partial [Moniliophthora roreri MCA 2997]
HSLSKADSGDISSLPILKREGSSTSDISFKLPEEQDPFQNLLEALKNSSKPKMPRPLTEILEDKKPQEMQIVSEDKEVKATLPVPVTGEQKNTKKFLLEVQLYVVLNLRAFKNDRMKELFMLLYMQREPEQFWKNQKIKELLKDEDLAKAPK